MILTTLAGVSPTHVGMDRRYPMHSDHDLGEPHARGDGPGGVGFALETPAVSPTHVGMDRRGTAPSMGCRREPHARGDGPELVTVQHAAWV